MLKEANIRDGTTALIVDISIRDLWQPQAIALLDVRVVDTDAPSHIHRNTDVVLSSAEEGKKENTTVHLKNVEHLLPLLLFPLMECWVERQISY